MAYRVSPACAGCTRLSALRPCRRALELRVPRRYLTHEAVYHMSTTELPQQLASFVWPLDQHLGRDVSRRSTPEGRAKPL